MRGMISLRFFNFRSRGYTASPQTIEHNVRWIKQQPDADINRTVKTFLVRKVVRKSEEPNISVEFSRINSDKKLAVFKAALVADFDSALGVGLGQAWFAKHVEPIAKALRAQLK